MNTFWQFLTSLRLNVTLLALAILLIFFGTLAQVDLGLYRAQEIWFTSWWVGPQKLKLFGLAWTVPTFPGGYTIGWALLISLTAAFIHRFQWRADKIGIHLTHAGVILMLLGQFLTHELARESHLSFAEGETRAYSEDHRAHELAFITSAGGNNDEVISIPEELLERGGEIAHEKLPFKVRVTKYFANSQPSVRAPMAKNLSPPLAANGLAQSWDFTEMPAATSMDDKSFPSAVIELLGPSGWLGTWVVTAWAGDFRLATSLWRSYSRRLGDGMATSVVRKLIASQTVSAGEKEFTFTLRPKRYYKPFNVTLLKTTHEIYRGTDIPKNFRSRVKIENPAKSETREIDIYMNHPLRYGGLTFYQYQMGRDEFDARRGTSTLQVVQNPSWLAPYASCYIVAAGMYVQFRTHLVKFLIKRSGEKKGAAWSGWLARIVEAALLLWLVFKFSFRLYGV